MRHPRYDLRWDRRHAVAVLALCAAAGLALAVRAADRPLQTGRRLAVDPVRMTAAAERIDPNTASVPSLRRLRGIGPALAAAIVTYRDRHGPRAFRGPEDLEKVKGIGPAKREQISRDLRFAAAD